MGTLFTATTFKKRVARLAKALRKEGGANFVLSYKLAKAYLRGDDEKWCALGGKCELNLYYPEDCMYDWSYGNWNEYP